MPTIQTAISNEELPESLLTLERIRNELRVPPGDTEHDDFITQIVNDMTLSVSGDLNIPVIEQSAFVILDLRGQSKSAPLVYGKPNGDPFVTDVTALYAASDNGNAIAGYFDRPVKFEARTPVNTENLPSPQVSEIAIISPANGAWPDPPRNLLGLHYNRGLLTNDTRIGDIRNMIILRVRAVYEGMASVPERRKSAYERILRRNKWKGVLPTSFERLS